ncbi:MAG: glycosyltransferase [Bacteroidota bacterium]
MSSIICTVTNDLAQDQRMIRICSSLQAAGYDVTLVGRLRKNSRPLVERSFDQRRLNCWFDRGKFFYLEYNLRLLWFLWRHSANVINSVDLDTLLPGYLISRLRKGTICVYDAHEYFTEVPEVTRRPAVQRIWSFLADWIIPQLKYAYTVGPALAKLFTERYRTPFAVIRNVPIRQKTVERQIGEERIILYQGMLNEGRGLETMIAAMSLLPEQYRLLLVGSGDVEAQLRDMAKNYKLEGRTQFTGFVRPDELPSFTNQAWLGLNLLENTGLSYYYSLANKAFDYIQAGVPSIQMDFPEYRALQEEYNCFLLLENLSAEALAQLILQADGAEATYQQLAQNCQLAATKLNWDVEEQILLAFYQQILVPKD